MPETSVRNLFRESGDAHIGQTLTRLASLAASAHRLQSAQLIQRNNPIADSREDQREPHGRRSGSVVARPNIAGEPPHTEVVR